MYFIHWCLSKRIKIIFFSFICFLLDENNISDFFPIHINPRPRKNFRLVGIIVLLNKFCRKKLDLTFPSFFYFVGLRGKLKSKKCWEKGVFGSDCWMSWNEAIVTQKYRMGSDTKSRHCIWYVQKKYESHFVLLWDQSPIATHALEWDSWTGKRRKRSTSPFTFPCFLLLFSFFNIQRVIFFGDVRHEIEYFRRDL